ncbi:MAG: hypothetical protein EZS28_025545, partial [Streblomastix strix]
MWIQVLNGRTLSFKNTSFTECQGLWGGALDVDMGGGGILIMDGSCKFINCKADDKGGAMMIFIQLSNNIITLQDGLLIEGCTSGNYGGGIVYESQESPSQLTVNKITLKDCVATSGGGGICGSIYAIINCGEGQLSGVSMTECQSKVGGGISSTINGNGKLTIKNKCQFDTCSSTNGNGGAIYAIISSSSTITSGVFISGTSSALKTTFTSCSASDSGGAIYLQVKNGGQGLLSNLQFIECESQYGGGFCEATGYGGGLQFYAPNIDYIIQIDGEIKFDNCKGDIAGGGAQFGCSKKGYVYVKKMTVKKCNSNKGGGIYFDIHEQTTLEVDQLSIEGCIAKFGGGIQIAIYLGTLSITGAMSIYNCNSTEDGGGFYITNSGGIINFKTPTASQILIDQCNAQNNGGGIQSQIYEGEIQSSIFEGGIINIDNTKFSKCISITGSGGGIISTINGTSKIDIQNSIFYQCKAAGTQYGGALYLLMNAGGQGIFSGIQFDECEAGYGGGIFTNIYVDSEVILDDLIFNKCKAYEDGGGLYERFSGGGTITMNGVNQFKNCEAGRFGGGFSHWTPSESYETIINDEIQFDNCSAGAHSGGMYVQCLKLGQFSANKITIKDCHSDMIGGLYIDIQAQFTVSINEISIEKCSARICSGIYISIISKGTLSIIGAMSIYKCNSTESGSGCNITNSGGIVNLIGTTESQIFFNKCKTQFNGGGIYSEIKSGGTMNIENAKFQKCISLSDNGGGIYSTISSTSKIDIKNSIFTQCNVTDAQYGGALYLLANGQGLLSNLQFDECLAGQGGSIYSTIIGAGKLTISNQCSFENCQSTSGSGGAIYVTLSDDNSGGFYIEGTGKTTFSLCTATDKGGSIYLELGSGAETKYSLSEASYLT